MLQVLIDISLKALLQKETWGYAKVIQKKGRKKRVANAFKFQERDMFSRSIVELG